MTTTPDSRIRADWTLPVETAAPPPTVTPDTSTTATPDTSTTAGKIAVMQAAERGERIESTPLNPRDHAFGLWSTVTGMAWNWGLQDYRIAPPTAPRSALAEARRCVKTGGWARGSIAEKLVREIDNGVTVTIIGNTRGDRVAARWRSHDMVIGVLPPGRFRLVRDES